MIRRLPPVWCNLGRSKLRTWQLRGLVGWNPQLGPLAGFIVTNAVLVQCLFLAFFIGILPGFVPVLGASRRSVAATLREVF